MSNETRYYLKVRGGGWRKWNGKPKRTPLIKTWHCGEPFRVEGCPDEFTEEVRADHDMTPSELDKFIWGELGSA
jgi:hypothetical protein